MSQGLKVDVSFIIYIRLSYDPEPGFIASPGHNELFFDTLWNV